MKNNRRRGPADRLFAAVIALLSVILAVLIIAAAVRVNRSYPDYISTPNEILRSIRNGYYADAAESMHNNIALGETAEKNPDYAVPYALAEYYEAASQYAAYSAAAELTEDAGKAAELREKAAEYRNRMETARAGMGDLAFMADTIDSVFGES